VEVVVTIVIQADPLRWGMAIPFPGVPLHEHRGRLEELDELGYSGVWTGEASSEDVFTPLALAAAWTSSLRLGTGIVPAQTRGPAVIAQTAASLCDAAPGRFVLGLGSSSRAVVESWNAQPAARPLARIRDLLSFLRSAWRGEKVTRAYETFRIDGFQLGGRLPDPQPKVIVAALRPRMLELAGRAADGAIVNWMSADDLRRVTPLLGEGAELVARVKVVVSADWPRVRAMAARMINGYFHVSGYRASQEWLGRGEALKPMWDAWSAGDRRRATELVPDEVINELFLWGDAVAIRRGLERYAACGATTTVPVLYGSPAEVHQAIRDLAPARAR
jgi:probable F420-dependent oxidoreductase